MKNRYMIFSKDNMVHRFRADDAKLAVCNYAEHCGCTIEKPILARIQAVMTLEELIEFFNSHCCLNYDDKITEIVGYYTTIYPEEALPTEKGGESGLLCPYICGNKNEYGYCKTTVCINQKFNQVNAVVVCPVCKQERRQGEMMLGVEKPICAYCYKKKGGGSDA